MALAWALALHPSPFSFGWLWPLLCWLWPCRLLWHLYFNFLMFPSLQILISRGAVMATPRVVHEPTCGPEGRAKEQKMAPRAEDRTKKDKPRSPKRRPRAAKLGPLSAKRGPRLAKMGRSCAIIRLKLIKIVASCDQDRLQIRRETLYAVEKAEMPQIGPRWREAKWAKKGTRSSRVGPR